MVLNKEIKLSVDKLENLTTLYLKQFENNTTTLKLEDLEPEEGYRYLFVYKKENEKKAYELPIENKSVGLDNYITNTAGVFFATIVAINAESEAVAIGETFRIVVQEGVYNEETATPSLPEPLESKYAQLVALMQDLEQKVASGYFKGEPGEPGKQGDDGFSPIAKVEPIPNGAKVVITDKQGTTEATILNGSDYELTEADKEEIASITEEAIKPTLEAKADKSELDSEVARLEREIAESGKVQDVQVDGTSVVTDGVANVPIAKTNWTKGAIQMGNAYSGIVYSESYGHSVMVANETAINGRGRLNVEPNGYIHTSNLDLALKKALTDGKGVAYNEQEKAMARERLGVYCDYSDMPLLADITLENDVSNVDVVFPYEIDKCFIVVRHENYDEHFCESAYPYVDFFLNNTYALKQGNICYIRGQCNGGEMSLVNKYGVWEWQNKQISVLNYYAPQGMQRYNINLVVNVFNRMIVRANHSTNLLKSGTRIIVRGIKQGE